MEFFNILICPGILMKNLMTSQKLAKGLNEPANMLIIFMVSIRKIMGLNLMFSGSKKKYSSQTNYDNTLVKLNVINKTIIFSI